LKRRGGVETEPPTVEWCDNSIVLFRTHTTTVGFDRHTTPPRGFIKPSPALLLGFLLQSHDMDLRYDRCWGQSVKEWSECSEDDSHDTDDLLADVRDARDEWDREMTDRMRELLAWCEN
jgi:hypothetical protein